jgi:co-chaperonin GroES (HSP10)
MNLRMLPGKALVEPLPVQEKSAGGIFLPQESVGDKKIWWKVLQMGEWLRNKKGVPVDPHFAVGDMVCTPLHFTHHTLEDGSGRKIVGFEQFEGKFETA